MRSPQVTLLRLNVGSVTAVATAEKLSMERRVA